MPGPAWVTLVLGLTALPAQAQAQAQDQDQAPPRPSITVLPIQATANTSPDTARLLSDDVVARMRQRREFSAVRTPSDLEQVVGAEATRQLLGCSMESCAVELAQKAGTPLVLTGTLGRLGSQQVLSLRILEAASGVVLASAVRHVDGRDDALLFAQTGPLVDELVGAPGPPPPPTPTPTPTATSSATATATDPGPGTSTATSTAPAPGPPAGTPLWRTLLSRAWLMPLAAAGCVTTGISCPWVTLGAVWWLVWSAQSRGLVSANADDAASASVCGLLDAAALLAGAGGALVLAFSAVAALGALAFAVVERVHTWDHALLLLASMAMLLSVPAALAWFMGGLAVAFVPNAQGSALTCFGLGAAGCLVLALLPQAAAALCGGSALATRHVVQLNSSPLEED